MKYDCTAQKLKYESHSTLFNDEQRNLFQTTIRDFEQNQLNIGPANTVSPIFFIEAPGGTGKTFVLNTIAEYLRAKVKVVLANASSGIAAVLLAGGRTAHARFKIPLKVLPDTNCAVTAHSDAGKTIIASYMIIWDESPMISKTVMASVDRLLQNLMSNTNCVGGKVMVFSGEFRQCLPIIF